MKKYLSIIALSCFCSPLAAVLIQNIEVEFPPSRFDWVVFSDPDRTPIDESNESEESEEERLEEEEEVGSELNWSPPIILTHREGDALELFFLLEFTVENPDLEKELGEEGYFSFVQKDLDTSINEILPNHRILLTRLDESKGYSFFEWELQDGKREILHGLCRTYVNNTSGQKRVSLLNYATTASKTESNTLVWERVLKNARF